MIIKGKKLSGILLSLMMLAVFILPVYAQPSGMPQINITEPKNGSTVSAGNVTITVDVKNFSIVDKQGQASVAGEGHIHYFMDVKVPTTPGKPSVTAEGTWVTTINKSYTWMNVAPGKHNFSVELVNNDHTPLTPPVVNEVNVTVMGAGNMSKNMTPAMAMNQTMMQNKTPAMAMNQTMMQNRTPAIAQNITPAARVNMTPSANASNVINVVAKNIAFNTKTITVPAGAKVTINFDNQDPKVQHNIAVYQTSAATMPIYVGKLITGPAKITYTFTAPSKPGTYFFRCDTHRTTMTGQFIVK